jgi:hypothetical protein
MCTGLFNKVKGGIKLVAPRMEMKCLTLGLWVASTLTGAVAAGQSHDVGHRSGSSKWLSERC